MTAMPTKKPILVHFPACWELSKASLYCPASYLPFTLAAYTIPTIPNGRQQKSVTRIDSTGQFFGRAGGGVGFTGWGLVGLISSIFLSRSEEQPSELQSLIRISYPVFCLNDKKCEHPQ